MNYMERVGHLLIADGVPGLEGEFARKKYEACVVGLDAVVGYTKR